MTDEEVYNCPNCGAPIGYSKVCQYCGTRLRWKPEVTTIEYVPKIEGRHTISVRSSMPSIADNHPEVIGMVMKDMADEIAKDIPKYWTFTESFDIVNLKRYYQADLVVLK